MWPKHWAAVAADPLLPVAVDSRRPRAWLAVAVAADSRDCTAAVLRRDCTHRDCTVVASVGVAPEDIAAVVAAVVAKTWVPTVAKRPWVDQHRWVAGSWDRETHGLLVVVHDHLVVLLGPVGEGIVVTWCKRSLLVGSRLEGDWGANSSPRRPHDIVPLALRAI